MDSMNPYEYAQHHELDAVYADVCNSNDEIDAVLLCLWIIDQERHNYLHAQALAPKDEKGRQKTLSKLLLGTNPQQHQDILTEWTAVYHWRSEIKDVKYGILDSCNTILEATAMGKKRRERLLPRFTEYLLETHQEGEEDASIILIKKTILDY